MDTLKPCPFCGTTVVSVASRERKYTVELIYFVECDNCQSEGPLDLGESGAIEKWNDRAVITDLNKAIEDYASLIEEFIWGHLSQDEFIREAKKLPKITSPLPQPTGLEGANLWD